MEGPGISTWEDVGRASIRIDQGCSDDLHNEPLRAPDIHQDDASGTFPTGGDSKAKKAQKEDLGDEEQADCCVNESELKEQLQGDLEMQGGELKAQEGNLRVQEDVHRVLVYDLGPQEHADCSVKKADLREQNVRRG